MVILRCITYKRPDGKRYEGDWVSGKQHGKGIYRNQKGESFECEWREGKRVTGSPGKDASGQKRSAKGTNKPSPGKKGERRAIP